jgi:hypothetical protein
MLENHFYDEKIYCKLTTGLLIFRCILMLFLFLFMTLIEPPAPPILACFLLVFLLFLRTTINFRRLTIRATSQSLNVGYGILKSTILWENIEDCYLDTASAISYGGWGIRIAKVEGRWKLVYNVLRIPRGVLSLDKGRFGELVISTKNPKR